MRGRARARERERSDIDDDDTANHITYWCMQRDNTTSIGWQIIVVWDRIWFFFLKNMKILNSFDVYALDFSCLFFCVSVFFFSACVI